MEVYAAMVTVMDEGIGRIIDELEKQDELDNTLIFFLQDNGGCAETLGMKGEVRPYHKDAPKLGPMSPGQLQRNMVPKVTRDGKPVMIGHGVMPGPPDTYIAYGREWANVSNTPFRLYKHWDHEGGISTPLIVHWPNGINSKGMLRQQIGHLIDIMPTCVDVSDAVYPKVYKGHKIQPMEGVSLVPAFNNEKLERQAPIFWEHEGNRAIRDGDWKLVAKGPTGNWQLYNMAQDRTEMNDLADKYPERTQKMIKMWENWAERANVIPWIWEGKYSPANYSK
jgi:arylsulfatase